MRSTVPASIRGNRHVTIIARPYNPPTSKIELAEIHGGTPAFLISSAGVARGRVSGDRDREVSRARRKAIITRKSGKRRRVA